jgi:hypothetical protein
LTEGGTVTVVPSGDAVSAPPPSVTVKVEEKDMPKFSARTIARLGDTCVTVG